MSGSAKAGTTAERHTCELQVLAGSAVRAPPKARVRRIFFSLDKRLTWMSGSAKAGTTAERHTCELQVLAGSAVRAPPKARVRRIFFSLDKRLTWTSAEHSPRIKAAC